MTEIRRLEHLSPAALDCIERHRILTQTGEVIPERCLSNSPPIGRGEKTSLTASSLFAGAGLMMTALGFYSDFTRRPVPARPLTWVNLPLLLVSGVVLAKYLFDSEKASRITLAGILTGAALAGTGLGIRLRPRINKGNLPSYLLWGGVATLTLGVRNHLACTPSSKLEPSNRFERGLNSTLTGAGLVFLGLGAYRVLKAPQLLPAKPVFYGGLGFMAVGGTSLIYSLLGSSDNDLLTTLSGAVAGIGLGALGVGLAIRPRMLPHDYIDDMILGGLLISMLSALLLLGVGRSIEESRKEPNKVA